MYKSRLMLFILGCFMVLILFVFVMHSFRLNKNISQLKESLEVEKQNVYNLTSIISEKDQSIEVIQIQNERMKNEIENFQNSNIQNDIDEKKKIFDLFGIEENFYFGDIPDDCLFIVDTRLPIGVIETFLTHRKALEDKDIELYKTTMSKKLGTGYGIALGSYEEGNWIDFKDINSSDNYFDAIDRNRIIYLAPYSNPTDDNIYLTSFLSFAFAFEDGKWLIGDIH